MPLDTSTLPSFVQVVENDRREYLDELFKTGTYTAELPPLVTTNFIAKDTGNSNPKFIRSSLYHVPSNYSTIKNSMLPFTLSLAPFAELDPQEIPPPTIDFGEMGPPRCKRCLAYISPFFEFVESGQRYWCPFCETNTPVHPNDFAHLGCDGRRAGLARRPELCLGSYEFVATSQYCKNGVFPLEPAFVFLIDVSYQSVNCGLLDLLCTNLPALLEHLPREFNAPKSAIKIALATYDQAIHFYDLSTTYQPQMSILSDVNDLFVPFVEGFFVDYEIAKANLSRCLESIRATFSHTNVINTILGPAIDIGMQALREANRNGKIFIFHTSLPTFDAPGRLDNREDRKLLGTDKEKTALTEATDYYRMLGKKCVANGVCVDVFLFPNAPVDLASIAPVSKLTGGSVYHYPYFEASKDGHRFLIDLYRDISRPIGFDVRTRVRTSTGIRPTGFYGSFHMDNVTDMQMGALDCDKSMQIEIKYDDKLNDQERVFIQVATLFTSIGGQRRIQVHNIALPVTSNHTRMFEEVDQNVIFALMFKQAETIVREKHAKGMRDDVVSRCAHILAAYREKCSEITPFGQLVMPDELKLLPLMGNCIVKSEALTATAEMSVDDHAWMMNLIPSMRVDEATRLLYPNILPLTSLRMDSPNQLTKMPTPVRASALFLQQNEAYILENGLICFVWIGLNVSAEWIQDVFGAHSLHQLDTGHGVIPERDNPHSRAVRQLLNRLNWGRPRQLKLFLVKPGDKLESRVKRLLVEDRTEPNGESYRDFIHELHRYIYSLLDW